MTSKASTNYFRRAIGIIICTAPLTLLLSSIFYSLTHDTVTGIMGIVFAGLGVAIGGLNLYLSFIRPRLYQFKQGSMQGYRFVSGVPIVGTIFVLMGGINGFGSLPIALLGIIAMVIDTGGCLWFLFYTWNDSSLWDS
jgi:hypothetical protein